MSESELSWHVSSWAGWGTPLDLFLFCFGSIQVKTRVVHTHMYKTEDLSYISGPVLLSLAESHSSHSLNRNKNRLSLQELIKMLKQDKTQTFSLTTHFLPENCVSNLMHVDI